MERRHFLISSAGITSIAGCLGDDPDEETETDVDDTTNGSDDRIDETETTPDPENLPDGFSENGIDDIGHVKDRIRTTWAADSFEFTFEPILTNYTRSIRIRGSNTGELHGTLANQNPGAPRDELWESELYSPPEDDTVYIRIDRLDDPTYNERPRAEAISITLDILGEELDYFSYSYDGTDDYQGDNAHIFDITGAADGDLNFGTGVPYDGFTDGRTVVSENGMVLRHGYNVTDTETSETAEPEWYYRTVDDVRISRPDWVDERQE